MNMSLLNKTKTPNSVKKMQKKKEKNGVMQQTSPQTNTPFKRKSLGIHNQDSNKKVNSRQTTPQTNTPFKRTSLGIDNNQDSNKKGNSRPFMKKLSKSMEVNVGTPNQQKSLPGVNMKKSPTVSPKTPKPKMFAGTKNLNSSHKLQNQDKPNEGKVFIKKNKPVEQKTEKATEKVETENRNKRKREKCKQRRAAAREKIAVLKQKMLQGDLNARKELEQNLSNLESIPEKSKNCERKIRFYKSILKVDQENKTQNKETKQNQKKAVDKKAPKTFTGTKQNKLKKIIQLNRTEQESESDEMSLNDELIEEASDEGDEPDVGEGEDESGGEEEEVENESGEEEEEGENESGEEEEVENESGVEEEEENESDMGEEEMVVDGEEESDEEVEDEDAENFSEGDSDEDDVDSEDDIDTGAPPKKVRKVIQPVKSNIKKKIDADNKVVSLQTNAKPQQFNKGKQNVAVSPKFGNTFPKGTTRYIVFVGNIGPNLNKEQLSEHFKKAGEVVDVRIPVGNDGPKGIAYVEFRNKDAYEKALSLNGTFVKGRRLNVQYTKAGNKSSNYKSEIKAKNFKFQAMKKQGYFAGNVRPDQKRSFRRAKQQQFEKK